MGLVTVNFECVDQELPPGGVPGVVVRVYETDDSYVNEFVAGPTGIATGLLNGEASPSPHAYNIRIYKYGHSVTNPQAIEIYDPPAGSPTGTNDFTLTLDPHAAQAPADARLCRCSGYFRRIDGVPAGGPVNRNAATGGFLRNQVLRFTSLMDPLIVDQIGAFGSPVYAEADDNGLIEIDLYRDGKYSVIVEDVHPGCLQEAHRIIHVPDRSTANLLDILFPVVVEIAWSPSGPWNLAVSGELDVTPTITASDYRVLTGIAADDVEYAVDDPTIASVASKDDSTLTITGVASGTTQLSITRRDDSIVRVPGTITGGVVTINVT